MPREQRLSRGLLKSKPEDRTVDEIELIRKGLENLACLRGVNPRVQKDLAAKFELSEFEKGDVIIKQNDTVSYWYIMIVGEAMVRKGNEDFMRLYEGSSFGEQLWFAGGSRDVTVVASTYCQVMSVSRDYLKFMQKDGRRGSVSVPGLGLDGASMERRGSIDRRASISSSAHNASTPPPPLYESPSSGGKTKSSLFGSITRSVRRMRRGSSPASMNEKEIEELEAMDIVRSPELRGDSIPEIDDSMIGGTRPMLSSPALSDSSGYSVGGDLVREVLETSPLERGARDIDTIHEEIRQMKAFSHFAPSLQRELCSVLSLDVVERAGTTLFRQGDVGTAWYITRQGEVEVLVDDKVVCTLGEGDGFGDWALVNDKPRSATIVTKVDDCQFLKVEKGDYRRILKTLEQNTVRLSEFGRVVLVLENRFVADKQKGFVVISGTPDKLFERNGDLSDPFFVADFLLTYRIFMTKQELWGRIVDRFAAKTADLPTARDAAQAGQSTADSLQSAHRIVWFVTHWLRSQWRDFATDPALLEAAVAFEKHVVEVAERCGILTLKEEATHIGETVRTNASRVRVSWSDLLPSSARRDSDPQAPSPDVEVPGGLRINRSRSSPTVVRSVTFRDEAEGAPQKTPHKPEEDVPSSLATSAEKDKGTQPKRARGFSVGAKQPPRQHSASDGRQSPRSGHLADVVRIYTANDSYRTIPIAAGAKVVDVLRVTLEKFNIAGDETTHSIHEAAVGGPAHRILTNLEAAAATEFMPETHEYTLRSVGPTAPLSHEDMARSNHLQSRLLDSDAKSIAWLLTMKDAAMFAAIDECEFIHYLYPTDEPGKGREKLTEMVQRFNDLTHWVITEICLSKEVALRVQVVTKFIKIAKYCRACNNLNTMCAIVTGLQHFLVQRMAETWERVPAKHMAHFRKLVDTLTPARNMVAYRSILLTTRPPLVPLLPLVMKDLTFINDGNPSKIDGLVNFEKLRMLARLIRTTVAFVSGGYDPGALLASMRAKTWTPAFGSKQKTVAWTAREDALLQYLEHLPIISDEGRLHALAAARLKEEGRDA